MLKNSGLDQLPEILPLSLHPEFFTELAMSKTAPNVLFVVKNWLIYRSEDGGETWTFSGRGAESVLYGSNQPTYFINEVATHPSEANVAYAGTIVGGATGGVFQSVDGGRTWTQLAGDNMPSSGLGHDAAPIVIDPLDPLRMYAGGVHSIFFRSSDGGASLGAPRSVAWGGPVYSLEPNTNLDGTFGCTGNPTCRTYYQFDLSSIPFGSTVQSATFELWGEYRGTSVSPDQQVPLAWFKVTSPWQENTITFNNSPTNEPTPFLGPLVPVTPPGCHVFGCIIGWDLTAAAQFWVNNPYKLRPSSSHLGPVLWESFTQAHGPVHPACSTSPNALFS